MTGSTPPTGAPQLSRTLGPVMLWGLGVGYVISGMYFGWNLGLAEGGTYGLAIATLFSIVLYITFTFSYTELACAIPKAGGVFDYATRALGKRLGFIAGIAQIIEFVFAPPAIAVAIGTYFHIFFPQLSINGIAIAVYTIFTALNIYGVKAAAIFELIITVFAVLELLLFAGITLPHFKLANFQHNAFPHGWMGVWASIPFAIWFFLGLEGVANVAEEAVNPQRNVLLGFGSALFTLIVLCILVFVSAIGIGGWEAIVYSSPGADPSDKPLPLALSQLTGNTGWLYHLLVTIGLMGLVASFHGIILASGRATFEFGKVGYIPAVLGKIHGRYKTPAAALLLNMVLGIIALLTGKTAEIITISCFGALTLYFISMISLLSLRKKEPALIRPFRVPLYPWFPLTALIVSSVCLLAMIGLNINLALIYFGILGLSYTWFHFLYKKTAMHNSSAGSLLEQLAAKDTRKVKLAVTDIDGILRGKMISFDKFKSIAEKGFGFCNVVFGWDANDAVYTNSAFTGLHTGYPDALAVPDLNTFRTIPWENGVPFFLADFKDNNGDNLAICPRSLLKTIQQRAADAGFLPFFAQEFEWFNFVRDGGQLQQPAQHLSSGMFGYSVLRASQHSQFFHDLFDLLTQFNVPVEGIHTETGPGVYEAAIVYAHVLEAADRAVCFKTGVKEIALKHNIIASFMAKFNAGLPGCSGHVHQSLWTKDGKQNLFHDAGNSNGISPLMKSYIAGQLYCLPHILPVFAPTVNSYKRLTEGAWAPTTVSWGIDNRTTALRALPAGATASRLETRVVGSDSNPYLAMAGCLAAGLYGIKHKMELTIPATTGNGYETNNNTLPKNLWEASQAMKTSAVAKELFGETFVDHFTGTREWEWKQFAGIVTDWELKRYFEII